MNKTPAAAAAAQLAALSLKPDYVGIGAVVFANDRHGRNEWTGFIITEQTPGLWIAGHHRINKKTMVEANGRGRGEALQWHSRQSKMDAEWREQHEHRIRESIRGCSVEQLRQIARIVGYGIKDK